jgi:hypothetical protein
MSLSTEAQALFDHARRSLPKWLTRGKATVLEWLYAYTEIFDATRSQGQDWLDITYIDNASGAELDQHAADRGTSRREGEDDATLRERLRNITDAVTIPALKAAIDALLTVNGLDECVIYNIRSRGAHMQLPGSSTAFFSRGHRLSGRRGSGYIVILPSDATDAIADAVREILRLHGPGGILGTVVKETP